ncbi:MAG: WD40 repeat domain-containing protein [Planctomycetales bacterium]
MAPADTTASRCRGLTLCLAIAIVLAAFTARGDDDVPRDEVAELIENAMRKIAKDVGGDASLSTGAPLRKRLDHVLQSRIDAIDQVCQLTAAQRRTLELAGRGDLKQLADRLEASKAAFRSTPADQLQGATTKFQQELEAMRVQFRFGPFRDESRFAKRLATILTPEQSTKYEQRRVAARHSTKVISVANAVGLELAETLDKDPYKIVWGRDGTHLTLVIFNSPVELFRVAASGEIVPFRQVGEERKVVGFDFSPNPDIVAIGENSLFASVINLATGDEIRLSTGNPQPSVRFSPDGTMLATGGYGTVAKLWSTTTGELLRELDAGPEGGLTPAFSPDGTILAIGNRNSVTRLYETASGRLLHVLAKPMSQGLRFDPTGKRLAVVYVDGSLVVWDVASGQLKNHVEARAEELYTVDWSPDGSLLATAGNNACVSLWNAADFSLLRELESPEWVVAVCFNPQATRLWFAGGGRLKEGGRRVEIRAVP